MKFDNWVAFCHVRFVESTKILLGNDVVVTTLHIHLILLWSNNHLPRFHIFLYGILDKVVRGTIWKYTRDFFRNEIKWKIRNLKGSDLAIAAILSWIIAVNLLHQRNILLVTTKMKSKDVQIIPNAFWKLFSGKESSYLVFLLKRC